MKNLILLKKKISYLNTIRVLSCLFVLSVLSAGCIQAQTDPDVCAHLKNIVENEIRGKRSRDSAILFVAAKDNNNAFKQAQELCIKLNARLTEKKGMVTVYTLPDENGSIKILDIEKDECLHAILYLKIRCEGCPLKEIRFIRLKCYNDLKE